MKESNYKSYAELPLFLNAATVAKVLGVAPFSAYELMHRTAKAPVAARRARVGGLCGFRCAAERVPARSLKTARCAAVRE